MATEKGRSRAEAADGSERPPRAFEGFDGRLPWHLPVWQRLMAAADRLPHAILLDGYAGTGKKCFADQLAAWLLCTGAASSRPCGQCQDCLWLKAHTHPALKYISPVPDEKTGRYPAIRIDDIRGASEFLLRTGQGYKILVIHFAHLMNIAAANALLKTLEEPPPNTLIVLETDRPVLLPPTILSRLHRLRLGQVAAPVAHDYLMTHYPAYTRLSQQRQQQLLEKTGFAPLAVAAALGHEEKWQELLYTDWMDVLQHGLNPDRVGEWHKRLDFSSFARLVQDMLLQMMRSHTLNEEAEPPVARLGQYYPVAALVVLWDWIAALKPSIDQNVQPQLLYNQLFLKMRQLSDKTA